MPNDYCAYVETFFLRKQKYFNESLDIWKQLSAFFFLSLLAVFSKCNNFFFNFQNTLEVYKSSLYYQPGVTVSKVCSPQKQHIALWSWFSEFTWIIDFLKCLRETWNFSPCPIWKRRNQVMGGWVKRRRICHKFLVYFWLNLSHMHFFRIIIPNLHMQKLT